MTDIGDIDNHILCAVNLLEEARKRIEFLTEKINDLENSDNKNRFKNMQTIEAIKMFRQRYDKRTNLQPATIQLIDYLESIFKDELQ